MDTLYKGLPIEHLIPEGVVLTASQREYLEATAYLFGQSDHVMSI